MNSEYQEKSRFYLEEKKRSQIYEKKKRENPKKKFLIFLIRYEKRNGFANFE